MAPRPINFFAKYFDHLLCAKRQLTPTESGINNMGSGSHERNGQEETCYDTRAHPRSGRARPEEDVMRQLHAFHLSQAGRQRVRYRARAFNSDCYPFETGRSAVRVRATDLSSTDGSCSLPPSQSSPRVRAVLGLRNARRLISLLSDTCAHVLASASARIAEHFCQLLDPVLFASGTVIEIEGLGGRLVRDTHAEPDDDILTTPAIGHITDPWRRPPMTLPWVL